MNQLNQQYQLQDYKVPGLNCFLVTNFVNIFIHIYILQSSYHKIVPYAWIAYIINSYLISHYIMGMICIIQPDKTLHKFYKFSCLFASMIHLLIGFFCFGYVFYLTTKQVDANIQNEIYFYILIAFLIFCIIDGYFDYSNYKYINLLITISSTQNTLSQSTQFVQSTTNQTSLSLQSQAQPCYPYVFNQPQLLQNIPQTICNKQTQQQFEQSITDDALNSSYSNNNQVLIQQNGYSQF
ncbi:hypothetical protein ABPG74_012509 [Tetrahymena malaccensis]